MSAELTSSDEPRKLIYRCRRCTEIYVAEVVSNIDFTSRWLGRSNNNVLTTMHRCKSPEVNYGVTDLIASDFLNADEIREMVS